MRSRKIALFLSAIIVAAVLGGCGSSNYSTGSEKYADYDNYSESYAEPAYASEEALASEYYSDDIYEMAAEEAPAEAGNDSASDTQLENSSSSRKLIKNVNMSVQTKEFDKLITTISSRIDSLGGYAETMEVNGYEYDASETSTRSAYIVARIPQQKLNSFVECVSENSNITSKNETTNDVTLEYTDVEAHRDSLKVEQKRLNELLEDADSLETILALESRLTEVRYELESYESRLRSIDNKVIYSTVYLNIREVKDYTPVVTEEKTFGQKLSEGFIDGCSGALSGLQSFIIGFVSILPGLLVFLIVVGIFVLIIVLIIRLIIKIVRNNTAKKAEKKQKKAARVAAAKTATPKSEEITQAKKEEAEASQDTETTKE